MLKVSDMWKKLLVFSAAFCLSLILLTLLKPKAETNPVELPASPMISNDSEPVQTAIRISLKHASAFKNSLLNLQNAVTKNDKETVVSLINFPVEVGFLNKKNKSYYKDIKSETEFLQTYDKIFDEPFKKCIAQMEPDKLLFSTSGEVFNSGLRMDRIYKNNGSDFEVKIIKLFRC